MHRDGFNAHAQRIARAAVVALALGGAACRAIVGFDDYPNPTDSSDGAATAPNDGASPESASGDGGLLAGDGGIGDDAVASDGAPPEGGVDPIYTNAGRVFDTPGSFTTTVTCSTLEIEVWGAGGGAAGPPFTGGTAIPGGSGGYAFGTMVAGFNGPLAIRVGEAGGNGKSTPASSDGNKGGGGNLGGGDGADGEQGGGGGGGFSSVAPPWADVLVVAGGGGGSCGLAKGGDGAAAGDTVGGSGESANLNGPSPLEATGGSDTGPGSAGGDIGGTGGSMWIGGIAGFDPGPDFGGGGGGSGYYGGGGGSTGDPSCGGGGAGGNYYAPTVDHGPHVAPFVRTSGQHGRVVLRCK